MSKRLTYSEVKEYIESFGDKLLSKEYDNQKTKLYIECKQGHKYWRRWCDYRQGCKCKACALHNLKTDINHIKNIVKKDGYRLLSKKYINCNTKLNFECLEGHIFTKTWTTYQRTKGCPYCSGRIVTYDFVKNFFASRGEKLLSQEYKRCDEKLRVLCSNNHEYTPKWINCYHKNSKCPHCAKNRPLLDKKIKKYVLSNEEILLSIDRTEKRVRLNLECTQGHFYSPRWSDYFSKNSRCPWCAKTGFNKKDFGFLYYLKINIKEQTFYKIGITNSCPEKRAKQLHSSAKILWVKSFLFGEYAYIEEQEILKKYSKYLANDSSLSIPSGYTELFTKDVLKKDKSLVNRRQL